MESNESNVMVSNEGKSRRTNEIPKNKGLPKNMQENTKMWGLYKQVF